MKRIAPLLFTCLLLLLPHASAALSATVTNTRTPTPTPEFVCVPPLCGPGQVAHCPSSCPGGCGLVCATPTPNCLPPADQIRFDFAIEPRDTLVVGQMVRITVTATNTSNLPAGLPQLTLRGGSAVFDRDPPAVGHSGPLGVFQANFDLVTVRPGTAQLTAFITYETQIGCPPDQFFGFWQATSAPAIVVVSGGQAGSPTPTPTPFPSCTPVFCPHGHVLHCPGVCPGGCGMVCATPTPTPACSPVSCGPGEVPFCRDPNTCICPQGCATLTPTPNAPPVPACPGDCNGDRRVDVGDLIQGVRAALALAGGCSTAFDTNADGSVTVDELIAAVNNALFGCPGPVVLRGTYDAE